MPVPAVRLKIRVRLASGSRAYVDPVFSPNGKLKPLYAVVDGKPEHHPEGIYNLRYLKAGKRVWHAVGTDAQLALTESNTSFSRSPWASPIPIPSRPRARPTSPLPSRNISATPPRENQSGPSTPTPAPTRSSHRPAPASTWNRSTGGMSSTTSTI
jgi:hypothetical protein